MTSRSAFGGDGVEVWRRRGRRPSGRRGRGGLDDVDAAAASAVFEGIWPRLRNIAHGDKTTSRADQLADPLRESANRCAPRHESTNRRAPPNKRANRGASSPKASNREKPQCSAVLNLAPANLVSSLYQPFLEIGNIPDLFLSCSCCKGKSHQKRSAFSTLLNRL